jgi:hypothetical protein
LNNETSADPDERPPQEYKYEVVPIAVETFRNLLRREGVISSLEGAPIVFTHNKLLDMRRLKRSGIIKSYRIMKVTRHETIVEEG